MDDRKVRVLIEQADRRRIAHDFDGAIDLLRRALSIDPDHASAHASLSLALLGARRLHGAAIEAGIALALDGNSSYCHYAAAAIRAAERKLDEAWDHVLVALHGDDVGVETQLLGARIRRLRGETAEARELLDGALETDPDHTGALVAMARLELLEGNLGAAQQRIEDALATDAGDYDAHIAAGYIALRRGRVDEAEEHARFALQQHAGDTDALELWTAIKARRNPLLGLWWRWNAFVSLRNEKTRFGLLIGSFVVAQLLIILAQHVERDGLADGLTYAWLAFCAYTWVAPSIFRRMLKRELATVVLRDDF